MHTLYKDPMTCRQTTTSNDVHSCQSAGSDATRQVSFVLKSSRMAENTTQTSEAARCQSSRRRSETRRPRTEEVEQDGCDDAEMPDLMRRSNSIKETWPSSLGEMLGVDW